MALRGLHATAPIAAACHLCGRAASDDFAVMEGQLTVYFDGKCPLCVREIAVLSRLDRRHHRLCFEDISPADARPHCPIDQDRLLARFHVRLPDGRLVDGARAFTEAWSVIPGLRWVRPLGRWPVTRAALNGLYTVFLKIRPHLQRMAGGRGA